MLNGNSDKKPNPRFLGRNIRRRHSSADISNILSCEERVFVPKFADTVRRRMPEGILIKPLYNAELIAESIQKNNYLSSYDREQHQVSCSNGIFTDKNQKVLHGFYNYVLLPNYRLFASFGDQQHHSYLSSGLMTKGAGCLYLQQGTLVCFSNESGHYKPSTEQMQDAISWFMNNARNPNLIFEDHSKQHVHEQPNNNVFNFKGIQFSRVGTPSHKNKPLCEYLSFEAWMQCLNENYSYAMNQYATKNISKTYIAMHALGHSADAALNSYGEESATTSDSDYYTKTESILKTATPLDDFHQAHPELTILTCVSRLLSTHTTSRYTGGLPRRISKTRINKTQTS